MGRGENLRVRKLDLDLVPQLKAKELKAKRKVLSKTLEGTWTALLKGRGMEFAGFRKYTYGDDASRIDWGASLRSKDTLIREFEEYKNVNVLFLLDVSDTMLFASERKLKAEFAAELVFNLAVCVLDNGDSVGYAMFADDIVSKELPSIGRDAIYKMAAALQTASYYGGKRNFRKVVTGVSAMLKERSLIIIVSDFLEMDERWEYYVRMLSQKFDLIGIMLRDPRDMELPDIGSQFLLSNTQGDETMLIDVAEFRDIYAHAVLEEREHVRSVFDASHSGFVSLTTGSDLLDPLLNYFRRRTAIIKG